MKIASLVAYALVGSNAHKNFNKLLVEKEAMDIQSWLLTIKEEDKGNTMEEILVNEAIESNFDKAQLDLYKAQVRESHTILRDLLNGNDIATIKERATVALNPKTFTKEEW